MSRKDFEAIAKVLNANLTPLPTVLDMADMLAEGNERFDKRKFVEASTILLARQMEHEKYMLDVAHGKR